MDIFALTNKEDVVTVRGIKLTLHGIPALAIQRAERTLPPKPKVPWIEVKSTVKGAEHTERVKDPSDEPYLEALAEWDNLRAEKINDAMLAFGVDVDMPADETWMEVPKYLGIDIPADAVGQKLAFLKYFVLNTQQVIAEIVRRVSILSGLSEEAIVATEESFRDTGERQSAK